MDFNPIPFNVAAGLMSWLKLVGILSLIALAIGLLGSFLSGGARGPAVFVTGLTSFVKELLSLSPRRIYALASLTVKEAVRRKALLVFVVFAILLMFGGWFLTDSNDRADLQVSVHITFMLTIISWLILPIAIFLSCWGIPEDIRIRSLHTVVTKPARRVEVVIGRMLGFSAMALSILLLMGIVGYIWIQRQVPDQVTDANANSRSLLTCRVPVYGTMFFLDRQGLPKTSGLNVGDPWMYRSFVEGNSRSRAVWLFSDIRPSTVGETLRVESRFEAFRTVKGTEESINEGLEAQYTLVNNSREDAFSSFGVGAGFRETADTLRAGNFENAASLLTSAAERMLTSPGDFPVVDCTQVSIACELQVVPTLRKLGDFPEVADAFDAFGKAAGKVQAPTDTEAYLGLSTACATLASVLEENAADMFQKMPRVEVPLEPFRVAEFHEGDDFHQYPRKLTYAADYEATARFLTKVLSEFNEQGKLLDGSELSSSLIDDLASSAGIAEVNAELVEQVLQEQIDAGNLTVTDGKLEVADGTRLLTFINNLVREERLISQDPAGWVLEADLFEDLVNSDGVLRVEVACLDDQMYLGMARPDLFIRLKDNMFLTGYSKALLNIGLMLSLVIVLGVTASCVVKGPVSFFFTLTIFVIGQFFHDFMLKLLSGNEKGAGMVESAMLMFQHRNPSVGADVSEGNRQVMQAVDSGFLGMLNAASNIIPDFSTFSGASSYIENGFDVPWSSSVLPAIATFVGFLVPCIVIGAACLKFRELEAK